MTVGDGPVTGLPEGYVDPTDPEAVAAVVLSTVQTGGLGAVTDLVGRLPGVRVTAAVPKGFLRAGVPAAYWLGPDYCWSCTDPPTLLHAVNGVVLHREVVEPGEAPALLGRLVPELVRRSGELLDASAVLSAARDLAADGLA
jgi:hypothetical protein